VLPNEAVRSDDLSARSARIVQKLSESDDRDLSPDEIEMRIAGFLIK
jgi:hypothetical protein